jgi:predicted nucleic acid-binding protein
VLVVDASVGAAAALLEDGFDHFDGEDLVAPALMWSEARSTLRQIAWRHETTWEEAKVARARLERSPVRLGRHRRLGVEAWSIADELGWVRTYDAEYLALARLLGCRVVTADERLRRGADRLGFVVTVQEL